MKTYKIEIEVPLPCDSHAEHFADVVHDLSVLMGLPGVVRWRRHCELPLCDPVKLPSSVPGIPVTEVVEVAGLTFDLSKLPF